MPLAPSELILNEDGSIYHLNLLPEDLAPIVITVGDPDRVERITQHFNTIRVTKHKREFKTQTGTYGGKAITVISTGIGTDNIDIVLNELDALVNIDFKTRTVKKKLQALTIIRLGTSGAIQPEIEVDSILISQLAMGFDSLLHFYDSADVQHLGIQQKFMQHSEWATEKSIPYVVAADEELVKHFRTKNNILGFTATNVGFYAPQGRMLRAKVQDCKLNQKIASFEYNGQKITNLEMETSGIYGLARLLGHRAVSINAILANRPQGIFSQNVDKTVNFMIKMALERIKLL